MPAPLSSPCFFFLLSTAIFFSTAAMANENGAAGERPRLSDNATCDSFTAPLGGNEISSLFGPRRSSSGGKGFHKGIDYSAPVGTPVLAAGEGEIVKIGRNSTYGRFVMLEHTNGIRTLYAHLARFSKWLSVGSYLDRGEALGKSGRSGRTTGPNLHFEIWSEGKRIDPLTMLADRGRNSCDAPG